MKGSKDYSKTVIYKIRCNDESVLDFYVGSTTQFRSRKWAHKSYSETCNSKLYKMIRANGGWENWTMVEVEVYPCNSSAEARIKEEYWRETLQAKLNVKRAYCSDELKSEQNAIRCKKFNELNADKIKEQRSQPINCGCGSTFCCGDKLRHENTKKHQEWLKTGEIKVIKTNKCGCGGSYQNDNKCNHLKTKRHKDFVDLNEIN